jgi:hypothetical protein
MIDYFVCTLCGCIVASQEPYAAAHDTFHQRLGELADATRETLGASAPGASCPACRHPWHGAFRCRVRDGGDNEQPSDCECVPEVL